MSPINQLLLSKRIRNVSSFSKFPCTTLEFSLTSLAEEMELCRGAVPFCIPMGFWNDVNTTARGSFLLSLLRTLVFLYQQHKVVRLFLRIHSLTLSLLWCILYYWTHHPIPSLNQLSWATLACCLRHASGFFIT